MYDIDELKVYKGDDIQIAPGVIVTQPTLAQITEFGEKEYFNAVHTVTASGADLKWQLWDNMHVDYTKIEDYDLFLQYIWMAVSSKKALQRGLMAAIAEGGDESLTEIPPELMDAMNFNPMALVLKDLDFADFIPCKNEATGETVLYDAQRDITVDRIVYTRMVEVIRKIHGLKRNNEIPGNDYTKEILIEEARDAAKAAENKPFKSVLKPMISALTVRCGLCGDERIWNMPIGMFLDNIRRSLKIQDADSLMHGAYSGFANLSGVDKKRFDWLGDME